LHGAALAIADYRPTIMTSWHLTDRVIPIDRCPLIMGIVNVTPDSFSDGGQFSSTEAAIAHGLQLVAEGADLLDIGGESTRPHAVAVAEEEELRRVVPVVEALARRVPVPISVDTSKAEVARRCLAAGAHIVNDVTALRGEAAMAPVCASARAGVLLMHMQGTPGTMQADPRYDDVVREIGGFFQERLHSLAAQGIAGERLAVDPGIGFGKTLAHNLDILARLAELRNLARPLCLGVSRKGFIGRLTGQPVEHRLAGSLAAIAGAVCRGEAQIVRVHDVAATRDAIAVWTAISDARHERESDP